MIYLDNAATTFPKPSIVYERAFKFMQESGGNPGRGGHHYSTVCSQMVEQTRRLVAQFFGVRDYRRAIFTYNCTDSINMVLKGLLRTGDHVVATNLDHNAVSRPLERLQEELHLTVTRVPFEGSGRIDPQQLRKAIRGNTKLIVLCHGSNVFGSVQALDPFVRIAQDSRISILLDAAQTAGRIAISIGDAPVFVVCSAHKSLYGMPGLGLLTVPEGFALRKWREGGTGTVSESIEHPDELPMRLEAGTPNFLAIASLQAGIEFIQHEGIEKIHRSEMALAEQLQKFLATDERFVVYSGWEEQGQLAVVAFNFRHVATEEAAGILDQRFGIAVRGGLHCAAVLHAQLGTTPGGCLRVSPGYLNSPQDIDTLTLALKEIAEKYA